MVTRLASLVPFLVLAVGCAGDGAAGGRTVERDSAGIAIVENGGSVPAWRVEEQPVLRIGVVAGDSMYQFHRIRFAGRLSDGRIVVADGGSSQIRWYGADGTYLSHAGRKGNGPQEFAMIGPVLLTDDDTLLVHDPRNLRVSWLSPGGSFTRELSVAGAPSGTGVVLGDIAGGSVALAVSTPTFEIRHPDLNYNHDTLSVVVRGAAGLDTVLRQPGSEGALWARFSGGEPVAMQQMGMPFGHVVLAARAGEGFVLANGGAHQLEFRDWTGALRRIARRPDSTSVQLSDADIDRYVGRAVDAARERGSDPAVAETNARDFLSVIPENHTMPSFDLLLPESGGGLWLRDFVPTWAMEDDHTWTVYGPDGTVRRRVTLPAHLTVMHVTPGFVTGVEHDSLDVEYVVVYRLTRAEADG